MAEAGKPTFYEQLENRHPEVFNAFEHLGKTVRAAGPVDDRTAHLIQLAAAAAIRSEGAVHSHTRRALAAGVTPDHIRHAMLMLISTIGMPNVVAVMSWIEDLLVKRDAAPSA